MENVVLVIHLFLALTIIGLVLLQRSEGGGLGSMGGGGGGLGGLTTAKGAANALTKATAYCAAGFFCTSLILGMLAGQDSKSRKGILEGMQATPAAIEQPVEAADKPVEAPAPEAPATAPAPAPTTAPEAPMAQ
jgi:preprotein translocase subunit SecG